MVEEGLTVAAAGRYPVSIGSDVDQTAAWRCDGGGGRDYSAPMRWWWRKIRPWYRLRIGSDGGRMVVSDVEQSAVEPIDIRVFCE